MRVLRGSYNYDLGGDSYVVGIGVFDSVHLGHQALLHKVQAIAAATGLPSLVYTFDPHPLKITQPANAPKLIEPLSVRLARLEAMGIGTTLIEPFTDEFARQSANSFARTLATKVKAKHVVVGNKFTFGNKQSGDVQKLFEWGNVFGYSVHSIATHMVNNITVSSSKIREYLWSGTVRGAAMLLGRPFTLAGVILRGAQRGTGLGFPTANLDTHYELIPSSGVYAGRAICDIGLFEAVVNIGTTPTFGGDQLKIEAHFPEYQGGPLYGTAMTIELIDRLRSEINFSDVTALKAQIKSDIEQARRVLG
ncbi:MAG: riboflavin biosynthesis protein RibF [Deltaproteobacteria bacterium]|nr:riboflavin biosynthesis protein RibF [Deltaproteobacteria bacterium]